MGFDRNDLSFKKNPLRGGAALTLSCFVKGDYGGEKCWDMGREEAEWQVSFVDVFRRTLGKQVLLFLRYLMRML